MGGGCLYCVKCPIAIFVILITVIGSGGSDIGLLLLMLTDWASVALPTAAITGVTVSIHDFSPDIANVTDVVHIDDDVADTAVTAVRDDALL